MSRCAKKCLRNPVPTELNLGNSLLRQDIAIAFLAATGLRKRVYLRIVDVWCSDRLHSLDRRLELNIRPFSATLPIEPNFDMRFDWTPFEHNPIPGVIGADREGESKAMTNLHRLCRQQPAGRFFPYQRGKLILLRKKSDHFGSTSRVPINEKNHTSVVRFRA